MRSPCALPILRRRVFPPNKNAGVMRDFAEDARPAGARSIFFISHEIGELSQRARNLNARQSVPNDLFQSPVHAHQPLIALRCADGKWQVASAQTRDRKSVV